MGKIFIIMSFTLFPFCLFAGNSDSLDIPKPNKDTAARSPKTVYVEPYIHHISDINFKDQEYKIELWLKLMTNDPLWAADSLGSQFAVADSKDLSITIVPQYQNKKPKDSTKDGQTGWNYRKLIKLNCTIIQNWDIKKYPFDKQKLNIKIYAMRSSGWLKLVPSGTRVNYARDSTDLKKIEIESGWFFNCDTIKVETASCQDIFDHATKYSAIRLEIPLTRKHGLGLFFKLFIGMYISFFVAFISLFIHVKHFEPRFGLPVGGLFAAIGNKYIMENILPQSSSYTIVDTLHTFTIIAILLIILFSAISLNLSDTPVYSVIKSKVQRSNKLNLMKWIDKYGRNLIIISYVALNIVFGFLNIV